ncbi:MAG: hypothetical protein ACLR7Z_20770 [Bilophila wadsworthia]
MVRPRAPAAPHGSLGIKLRSGNEILSIGAGNAVTVRNEKGREETLSGFDTLVVAVGCRPDNALSDGLSAALDCPCVAVGDCRKTAKIMDAVHSGFEAALTL